jgi:hypothetical protein
LFHCVGARINGSLTVNEKGRKHYVPPFIYEKN